MTWVWCLDLCTKLAKKVTKICEVCWHETYRGSACNKNKVTGVWSLGGAGTSPRPVCHPSGMDILEKTPQQLATQDLIRYSVEREVLCDSEPG